MYIIFHIPGRQSHAQVKLTEIKWHPVMKMNVKKYNRAVFTGHSYNLLQDHVC